jgi:diacylglycerol diphosphate phosphatase/phosphatidate phosphatase
MQLILPQSKAWLVFSPLMVSIYICITRVTDHRHHPSDVALGFAVGLFPTYIFYRQFYPALEDPNCNLAYPPRHLAAESDRGPARTWGPRNWFSTADRDDGPTPLLPTNRSTRGMRGSTSNLGHAEVELDSGLIATPYASELGHGHDREMVYSGMPKSPDHSST